METTRALKDFIRRHGAALCLAGLALLGALYLRGVPQNPPGFFVDESSIAYNAYSVARTGADEHGERFPLFFRAFGEYKSPVYVYMLAAVYKLTGPSIFAARLLSALLGILAAALLGLLAARATGRAAGCVVCASALLTPWLFEVSRLVFEVALMPLLVALFLLLLRRASEREDWGWASAAGLASALALITYTYSAGRLLAPLFAAGLLFFVTRRRWRGVVRAWFLYAVALVPLFLFNEHHPGALGARFYDVSYITPQSTAGQIVLRFVRNYLGNFSPVSWLLKGDPEPRHHLPFMGSLLAASVLLAALGLAVVVLRERRDAWWRFVVYGLLVAPVPASLTLDHFHTLRLVALPVFLLALAARGAAWLLEGGPRPRLRRGLLIALLLLTLAQGLAFQWRFQRAAPARWHNFDAFYPEVFDAAVRLPERPIYILDNHAAPGYMHAYWYATLRGMDTGQFVRLDRDRRPPAGSLVISTELPCTDCQIILQRGPFRLYRDEGSGMRDEGGGMRDERLNH